MFGWEMVDYMVCWIVNYQTASPSVVYHRMVYRC